MEEVITVVDIVIQGDGVLKNPSYMGIPVHSVTEDDEFIRLEVMDISTVKIRAPFRKSAVASCIERQVTINREPAPTATPTAVARPTEASPAAAELA